MQRFFRTSVQHKLNFQSWMIHTLYDFQQKQKYKCTLLSRNNSVQQSVGWLVGCAVVLRPLTLFRSFRARSVNLTTLFLGKDRFLVLILSRPVNWQLPFLNLRKGENGRRNCFHDQISTKECGRTELEPATPEFAIRLARDCARRPGYNNIWSVTYTFDLHIDSSQDIK